MKTFTATYTELSEMFGMEIEGAEETINGKALCGYFDRDCPKCRGTGKYSKRLSCFRCSGTGKVEGSARAADNLESSNPAVFAWISANRETNSFARSLSEGLENHGSLTPNQITAVERNLVRPEGAAVDVSRIETAFAKAHANKIKTPKLRLGDFTFSRAPDTGRNAGSIYVKRGSDYLGKVTAGRFHSFKCDDATRDAVVDVASKPDEAAKAYGLKTGVCSCCGRTLTNGVSVERGIGPICAENFGW